MKDFITGPAFTFVILGCYGLRFGSHLWAQHWGRAAYWFFAIGITISAEFLMKKWP